MDQARFLQGSTMRHVIVMSSTSSVGLMAIFLVDLIDMFFLSMLGETELVSAIGYSGSILFFTTSVCIGLAIAIGALVARSVGAQQAEQARRYLVNTYVVLLGITGSITVGLWFLIPWCLELLGATGRAAELSIDYLQIMIPSMPILGMAIGSGAALRAVGDAKRSMYSTLGGSVVNAVLDPIFIFTLGLGIQGAAIASVCARVAMFVIAFYPVWKHHQLLIPFSGRACSKDLKEIFRIAIPAICTNISTPIGAAYVTAQMSQFGDEAVAGMSIIGRLAPVAFGVVFATSGAIGPIVGQNFGAKNFGRVRCTLNDSLKFVFAYVLAVCMILYGIQDWIVHVFGATGDSAYLIKVFCSYVAIQYALAGATFIGNASFNNLGKAQLSTIVNFGKATIGTMPFVYYGAQWHGALGVLVGQAIGTGVFGVISIISIYYLIHRLKQNHG